MDAAPGFGSPQTRRRFEQGVRASVKRIHVNWLRRGLPMCTCAFSPDGTHRATCRLKRLVDDMLEVGDRSAAHLLRRPNYLNQPAALTHNPFAALLKRS